MVKAIQKARNNVVQKQNQNELTQWLEARSVWASQEAVHLKMERWVIQANPRTRLLEESENLSITYQTEIQMQIRQLSLNVRYQVFITL